MLELPAFAFLIWASYFLFRYLDSSKACDLYLTCGSLLAAVYTKQSTIFVVPVFLITLYFVYGNRIFQHIEVYRASALFCLGAIPLAVFTWLWGRLNVLQAAGGEWTHSSRMSLFGWLYVARQWPRQVSWTVLALALAYCSGVLLWKNWRLPTPVLFFFGAWLGTGYLFFTLVALKAERFTIFLTFSLVFFAVLAILKALPAGVGQIAALLLAVGTFTHTLIAGHVPAVSGDRDAARYVCSITPPDGVLLFSGQRDGSFIFNVRTLPECKNLTVLRSDKLLLMVEGNRFVSGAKELGIGEEQFIDMLRRYGVRYVIIEPNFWSDLSSMQMLARVLHRATFRLLATIPVVGDRDPDETQLEIYQVTEAASQPKAKIRFDLSGYGVVIEGNIGRDHAPH